MKSITGLKRIHSNSSSSIEGNRNPTERYARIIQNVLPKYEAQQAREIINFTVDDTPKRSRSPSPSDCNASDSVASADREFFSRVLDYSPHSSHSPSPSLLDYNASDSFASVVSFASFDFNIESSLSVLDCSPHSSRSPSPSTRNARFDFDNVDIEAFLGVLDCSPYSSRSPSPSPSDCNASDSVASADIESSLSVLDCSPHSHPQESQYFPKEINPLGQDTTGFLDEMRNNDNIIIIANKIDFPNEGYKKFKNFIANLESDVPHKILHDFIKENPNAIFYTQQENGIFKKINTQNNHDFFKM